MQEATISTLLKSALSTLGACLTVLVFSVGSVALADETNTCELDQSLQDLSSSRASESQYENFFSQKLSVAEKAKAEINTEKDNLDEIQNQWIANQIECLQERQIVSKELASALETKFLPQQEQVTNPHRNDIEALLGEIIGPDQRALKIKDAETEGNQFRLLVDGKPLREAITETIRGAEKYIHISSMQLWNDQAGKLILTELVAKKLNFENGDKLNDYLIANKLNIEKNSDQLKTNFVEAELSKLAARGEMSSEEISKILSDDGLREQKFLQLSSRIEIRVMLDFWNYLQFFYKGIDLAGRDLIPTLRKFGAEVVYVPSFWMFVDHMKTVITEKQAVLSGGNYINKVFNWNWSSIEFHDAGVLAQGPIINQMNRFYSQKFNLFVGLNKVARYVDLLGQVFGRYHDFKLNQIEVERQNLDGSPYYFSAKSAGVSKAKIVYTSDLSILKSKTRKALQEAVKSAQKNVFIENPFFTDDSVARLLIKKAKSWHLRKEKEANGELPKGQGVHATCDLNKIHQRKSGHSIVVVMPKYGDQLIGNIAHAGLENFLLDSGVDICRWSGGNYDTHKLELEELQSANELEASVLELVNKNPDKAYTKKAMLHDKIWTVDDKLTYVGTANLAQRSFKGDMELGILIEDPAFASEVNTKIMAIDMWNSDPARARLINYLGLPVQIFFTKIFPIF